MPYNDTKTYYTANDNQTTVDIIVLQGDEELAEDNHTLGEFSLTGIPPRPAGQQEVIVDFKVDANGELKVHAIAKDLSGVEKTLIISKESINLKPDQVYRLQQAALMY